MAAWILSRGRTLYLLAVLVVMLSGSRDVLAQQSHIYHTDGVALNGYDVVAYFKTGKPRKGDAAYSWQWENVTWLFQSQENLDHFKDNPGLFMPQFGGWCAYGVSEDHKSPTDPDAWTIVNGKLYLNYNTHVKKLWLKDRDERIEKAELFWEELKDKSD